MTLLQRWIDGGLELGNHGFAHLDLRTSARQASPGCTAGALTRKMPSATFASEPAVPDWVTKASAVRR